MAHAYEDILYFAEDGVAWVTLNRPEALNALSSGQLPDTKGASASAQPTCVDPLRPAWPIWQQIFASVSAWTKSTTRFHATSCSGA